MEVRYVINSSEIEAEHVREVFENSGIHRPVHDLERIKSMIEHADIIVSAWMDQKLIGIARAITDFCYCCYLSDLAVDKQYQNYGIGNNLIKKLQGELGDKVSIVLLSSQKAMDFYSHIGFEKADNAYKISRKQ